MKYLQGTNFEERYNADDLVGLDRLRAAIKATYIDQHVTKVVYEHKLWSLVACRDLAAAQRMLDFEIALAEYFSDKLYFTRDHEMDNTVFDALDEMDEISHYEEFLHKWRNSLQQDMRCERSEKMRKELLQKLQKGEEGNDEKQFYA